MKSRKTKVAPLGIGLALSASLFASPALLAHADGDIAIIFNNPSYTDGVNVGYDITNDSVADIYAYLGCGADPLQLNQNNQATVESLNNCRIYIENDSYGNATDYPDGTLSYQIWINGSNVHTETGDNQTSENDSFNISNLVGNGNSPYIIDITADNPQGGGDPNDPQAGPEQGQSPFDGKVYLFWDCGKSDLCYHYFDNIPNDGSTAYFNASEITADRHPEITFDPSKAEETRAGYSLKNDWEGFIANHDEYGIDDVAGQDKYDLNPVDSPRGAKNSFTHFGDRNFKIVIKNNNFVGVTVGNFDDLTYVPGFWDALQTPELYDVSGTTASNPTIIRTVLVEPTITLSAADGGMSIDITNVTSVNGLTNNDVTITNNNDGTFTLTFHSNYYDHEVFKLTTAKGDHYIRIVRQAVIGEIPMFPDQTSFEATATVYYPSNYSCGDFTVTAKIIYDGKAPKTVEMSEADSFIDGLGHQITGCETNSGKNLTEGHFVYNLGSSISDIKGIYFNVSKKSDTAGNFGGVFSGSGQGTYFDKATRNIDWTK